MGFRWRMAWAAIVLWGGLALVVPALVSSPAVAQAVESEDPADARATEFRAVRGPEAERVPGGALLIGAYALVWALLLGFVLRLGWLHARTSREIEELARRLEEEGAGPPSE